MRVLIVTRIFPSLDDPTRGIYSLYMASALSNLCDLKVVVPTRWWAHVREPAKLLHVPQAMMSGIPVDFPTYWFTPKLESTHGRSMYASIRPFVRNLHRNSPFDAVIGVFAYPDAAAAGYVADALDIPLVIHVLGSDINVKPHHSATMRKQVEQTLNRAYRVVAVSEALRSRVLALGVDPNRAVTCHNGVNGDQFHPRDRRAACSRLDLSPDRLRIGFVGNFEVAKGVDVLVKAFAEIVRSGLRNIELVMVGDGTLRQQMESEVGRLGLGDCVRFPGRRGSADVPDWMAASDVMCLPSRTEGCPNVVLESLACGRPVVGSAIGGVPELLDDRNGVLVPPDDPGMLAAALRSALERTWDPAEIRRTVPHLSWNHYGEFMKQMVDASIEEKSSRDRHAEVAGNRR